MSAAYGTKTTSFSTFEEMTYAQAKKKIFPIRMLREGESFEVDATEFYFESGVKHFKWEAGAPMPARLIEEVLKALRSDEATQQATTSEARPLPSGSSSGSWRGRCFRGQLRAA